MTDFPALISLLAGGRVEFIIVGGAAATAHGSARLTRDLDVVYRRAQDNVERLVAALAPYKPYLRDAPPGLPFSWDERSVWNGLNFTLTTSSAQSTCSARSPAGAIMKRCYPTQSPYNFTELNVYASAWNGSFM